MATQPSRVERMKRYLDEHAEEIERIGYGKVEFVFAGPAPLRATRQRSDQIGERSALVGVSNCL